MCITIYHCFITGALVVKLNDKTAPDVIPYKVPPLSRSEDIVVIYNRVPKTGSTSFVNIAYELCKKNHFKVLHINVTGNFHLLSMKNQVIKEQEYL